MTDKELRRIFKETESDETFRNSKDNALEGLNLLSKYGNGYVLRGAGHEVILSFSGSEIRKYGIPKEVLIKLAKLNWGFDVEDYDGLFCHV